MKKTESVVRGRRRRHSAQILREEIVLRQRERLTVPDIVEHQAGEIFVPLGLQAYILEESIVSEATLLFCMFDSRDFFFNYKT